MKKASDVVNRFIDTVQNEKLRTASGFQDKWKTIICETFRCYGSGDDATPFAASVTDHINVVDVDRGIVHIEVDHPGWIQTIQFKRKGLISKLRRAFPSLEIHTLAFHVVGDNSYRHPQEEKKMTREELSVRIEERLPKDMYQKEIKYDENIQERIKNTDLEKILEKLKKTLEVVD